MRQVAHCFLTALFCLLLLQLAVPGWSQEGESPQEEGAEATEGSGELLTNEDIIALVKAGLPEGVVVEKIRTSETRFDTSTDALVTLKQEGISDTILRLMVNPDAELAEVGAPVYQGQVGGSTNQPAPCQVPTGSPAPWLSGSSPAMWYSPSDEERRVEMQYERGTTKRVGFAGFGATLLLLRSLEADLRVPSESVFFSCINPTDAPLVRFSIDKEENNRNTSVGRGGPWNQEFNISEEDLVDFSFEKTPAGYFKIRPEESLSAGEYGFVPQGGAGFFATGERVYSFGVD